MQHLSAEHPFPGLRPFQFADRDFFFGRDDQLYSLYRLFELNRFIAVIGSSGSGKSSLVRAGLLPLLNDEAQAPDAGSRDWRIATLTPGDAPLARLADALAELDEAVTPERRDEMLRKVRASSLGLSRTIAASPSLAAAHVLLVIDQFEELFRFDRADDTAFDRFRRRDEATNFVQLLLESTRDRARNVFVLITMRSDFIGDCARFNRLPEAVTAAQFLVPSLTRDQREEAILGPLTLAGATIEPDVVNRLIADVGNETDQLPVLQHCLLRMWEDARETNGAGPVRLTTANYVRAGQVQGAISKHADDVMADLPGLERTVERVFRALGERDRDGRATRRALSLAQLEAETGEAAGDVRAVIERFRADDCSFLLTSPSTGELTAHTRIDVVHEALLRRWHKISGVGPNANENGWLAAEEHDGRIYRGLLALVESNTDAQREVTLPAMLVEERLAWWAAMRPTPAWAERYGGGYAKVARLLDDSRRALATERAAAEARLARDRELADEREANERRRLEAALRTARITRRFFIVTALLFCAAVAGMLYAFHAKTLADKANLALGSVIDEEARAESLSPNATEVEYDRTIAAYTAVIRIQPSDVTGRVKRGLAYFQEERFDEAIADLQTAVGMDADNAEVYRDLGAAYSARGELRHSRADYERSTAEFNRAIALNPESADAFVDRGLSYHDEGFDDRALSDMNYALTLDPHLVKAYLDIALVYSTRNQLDREIDEATRALAVASVPNDKAAADNTLGNAMLAKTRYADAIADFSSAITFDPTNALLYTNRGQAYMDVHNSGMAFHDFSKAIELKPHYQIAYYLRAINYVNASRFPAALADILRLIELDPENPYWHSDYGYVLVYDGAFTEAISSFNHAIDLNPREPTFYINRGAAWYAVRQYRRAIADDDRAIALHSTLPGLYGNRALANSALGRIDQAGADLAQAKKLDPAEKDFTRMHIYYGGAKGLQ